MRVLIDACVLYPTVMREVLIGVAQEGLLQPLWSERILEEWARATVKLGPVDTAFARGEIATLKARFPAAMVGADPAVEAQLYLPDPDDTHVLAAAITGQADSLLTLNTKDFPSNIMAQHGIIRRDPDGLLRELFAEAPDVVRAVADRVRAEAERLSGQPQPMRSLLKKARLPRLAKALTVDLDI
jgi:predicted nucleic acid-binding protein